MNYLCMKVVKQALNKMMYHNTTLPFNSSDSRSLERRKVVGEGGHRLGCTARDQLSLGRRPTNSNDLLIINATMLTSKTKYKDSKNVYGGHY